MHRCLQIREVLEDITEYLAEGLQKKTLASLSQTCTMLHGAAQDALWCDADLRVVLQCFPTVCWEIKEASFVSPGTLIDLRLLTASHMLLAIHSTTCSSRMDKVPRTGFALASISLQ